jgi:hypothetical protein
MLPARHASLAQALRVRLFRSQVRACVGPGAVAVSGALLQRRLVAVLWRRPVAALQ